jgi:hypothetical protein
VLYDLVSSRFSVLSVHTSEEVQSALEMNSSKDQKLLTQAAFELLLKDGSFLFSPVFFMCEGLL